MKFFERLRQLNRMSFFNKNLGESQRYTAFTLAEVLITLGIIGIVATLTIPSLVGSYQKQATVSKLKKAYSVMNQAINLSQSDNGPLVNWQWRNSDGVVMSKLFSTYFAPYLSIQKYCYQASDCNYTGSFYMLNGSGSWGFASTTGDDDRLAVILNDGTLFQIMDKTDGSRYVHIDINGNQPPNVCGKDVFLFVIDTTKGLVPYDYGRSSTQINSDCNKYANGWGCAAKIINDGWKISGDYPWR